MKRRYETVFILTPVLSEAQAKETVVKFKKLLKEAGAKFHNEEFWGMKKLAYPIQKKATGFYYLVEYKVEGAAIADLEVGLKRNEKILRFLTTVLDKHSIAYNEKKRRLNAEKKEKIEKRSIKLKKGGQKNG